MKSSEAIDAPTNPRTMPLGLMLSRRFAFAFGLIIPILEIVRRWGVWGYPPAWLDDFFIGAFLLIASFNARRSSASSRAWLAGAWGFTAGITYTSFFTHLQHVREPDPGNIPQVWLTSLIGLGFLVILIMLTVTLRCSNPSEKPS